MSKTARILIIVLLLFSGGRATAQYYDWGQDPASIKWMQIKTKNGKVVFPDYYTRQAVKMMHYMDTVRTQIGYGFKHSTTKFPLFVHTQNFSPNGLVVLAPKRMELITTPPAAIAAMPWLKQLSVHEFRHNVQFSNIDRNVFRVLGRIFGQHGSLIGAALFPLWAMEGDAVLTETQFSSFGRGLQPSFTIDYRALALEGGDKNYPIDKYFAGSYKDYLPNHYNLGYQLTSWAYTKYGSDYWSKVVDYGTRRPYQLFTAKVAQRKYFGTSTNILFNETFDDLNQYWRSLPLVDNSSQLIKTPVGSFTTYSSPIELETGEIVALKEDFDNTSRIVIVNPSSGKERVLHRTGLINTGLDYADGRLWWSELRHSTFWEQRVNSQVCWYDLASGKSGVVGAEKRVMYPVGMDDKQYGVIEYDYSGNYTIKYDHWQMELPDTVSLHGLAYDNKTAKFYFIALSDAGMWIGSTAKGDGGFEKVTRPNYSTISGLKAHDGKLYYSSIASGKDEIHLYDLEEGREYQITTSRYGSFAPAPSSEGGEVLMTTYTTNGYVLARQSVSESELKEVEWREIPLNVVNPERVEWGVKNIDKIVVADTTSREVKKFRKGFNLFQFHSWAPMHYEPDKIISESRFNINLGVALLSQNILNSMFTTLGYKYTEGGSSVTAGLRYYGLAPKFELDVEYGNHDQIYYPSPRASVAHSSSMTLNNMFNLKARVFLPILLSSGYHLRWLTPAIEFQHDNAKIFYPNYVGFRFVPKYRNGLQKMVFTLQYTDNVRMGYRDFLPKWGYALRVRHTSNPWSSNFGKIWSGYARAYLPGVMKQHSLMLRGAVQKQSIKFWGYRQKELFPRGATYRITPERYWSVSGDYQFPIWYPDGGIPSLLYFKRIRANVWGDYARYREKENTWRNVTSYGVDLTFDIVPLRLPSSTKTSVTISIQKPSTHKGVVFAFAFGMPI